MKNNGSQTDEYHDAEIAIIGLSGRFPGARNIEEFWRNIQHGVETISFFSEQELLEQGNDPRLIREPNYVRAKGFLEDLEGFDAAFFEYTPKEAAYMDPQFRLLHECVWEALEDAGCPPRTHKKSIGLFAGAAFNEWWLFRAFAQNMVGDSETLDIATVTLRDYLCTLLSYKFDLKGPSFTIQTACSTSLVAVHQACQALLSGECRLAVAGGVSINLPVRSGYLYQEGMINSPDGHCRAFDAQAAGTVFSDGAGIVVLKRLSEAQADGDHIYAVIRGSAINNDGHQKVGYTAPSPQGQAAVIRAALAVAEVEAESVSYVEAHGTGTALGDPIEMQALQMAFRSDRRGFCWLGSVKSNIGHLNAASGVAGLLKTVLALQHRQIPPSLHFQQPNPRIDFANSPFRVADHLVDWTVPAEQLPRRAGVSSFGIGGTNAHVILQQAPEPVASESGRPVQLLLLSARTQPALVQLGERLHAHLLAHPDLQLADVAYTLQVGRARFGERRALVCGSRQEALAALAAPLEASKPSSGPAPSPAVYWLFPGQGSQYVQMGRQFYEQEPLVRQVLEQGFALAEREGVPGLRALLYPELGEDGEQVQRALSQTQIAQPLLFVLEYALAQQLLAWGLRPQGLLGHSLGEWVAACVAGVCSFEQGLRLVLARGRLMSEAETGAMLSVRLEDAEIGQYVNERVVLAAHNAPGWWVLAGPREEVEQVQRRLEQEGKHSQKLHTSHAFHSPSMQSAAAAWEALLRQEELREPRLPWLSNLTGRWITSEQARDAGYWRQQMCTPVQFAANVGEVLREEGAVLLEVGPGQSLSTFARQGASQQHLVLNLLRHPQEEISDTRYLLGQLGRLWQRGVEWDWAAFDGRTRRQRLSLPTYPFQRQRFWLDTPVGVNIVAQKNEHTITEDTQSSHEQPGESLENEATKYEKVILKSWSDLLGVEASPDDNFFDVGGDSLKATALVSRLQKECGVAVRLKDIFQFPTVRALGEHIQQLEATAYLEIMPAEKKPYYALSSSQRRTYIIQRNIGLGTTYNYPMVLLVHGQLNKERIEAAFLQLIERHEILRTTFAFIDGEPMQQVHEDRAFSIHYTHANDATLDTCIHSFIQPFHLDKAPLLRATLIKLAEQKHALLLDMHNIIADGASMNIFVKEFCQLYKGEELPPLTLQYKDYAEWQQRFLESPYLKRQEAYWLEKFSDIPLLNMPLDFSRSQAQDFAGETIQFVLSCELSEKLRQLAKSQNVTLNTIFYSLYTLLLHKYTDQEDIIVGSLVAGRRRIEVAGLIGLFTNFLPVRNSLNPNTTFTEFLAMTQAVLLEAYDNQDYPFDLLVEKLGKKIPRDRNPLFDAMFVYHNEYDPNIKLEVENVEFAEYEFAKDTSKLDLKLDIVDLPSGEQKCVLQYNHHLYLKSTIERLIAHFLELLQQVLHNPAETLANLPLFAEKRPSALTRSERTPPAASLPEISLVISATFVTDPVELSIKWWGERFGWHINIHFSAYNQLFQDLLDPASQLSVNTGVNVLLIRFEDWLRDDHADEQTQVKKLEHNFQDLVQAISKKSKTSPYVVALLPGEAAQTSTLLQTYIDMLNYRWKQALSSLDNVYVLDCTPLADQYQISEVFDPHTDRAAHLPFTDAFYAAMGTEIARSVLAWQQHPFKVIVLDCDNTLWHGIVGEDGPAGLRLDTSFRAFQEILLQKSKEGFLLALCSKNNEKDVWEVFDAHPQMILKKEHFVAWRVNWQEKSQNVREIASELQLDLRSFIVIDDSATECAELMTYCPEVLTLQMPSLSSHIPSFLSRIWALDKVKITAEDQQRTSMYLAEKRRQEAREEIDTYADFLQGLGLQMSMNLLDIKHLSRVAQMTQRTNQFNLSTIRRSEQQIQTLLARPDMQCWTIEVVDRFGSYGVSGTVFAQQRETTLFLDTFLLSCRVLGRTIEDAIIATLVSYCREHGLVQLEASYYPTPKNQPVREFFDRTGWSIARQTEEYTLYTFDVHKLSSRSTHRVQIYYNAPLPEEQITPVMTASAGAVTPLAREIQPSARFAAEPEQGFQWKMVLTNEANLLHRKYYIPFEYPFAASLMQQLREHRTPLVPVSFSTPPTNALEEKLCTLWAKALGVAQIGIDENFFEAGGNSLLAVKLEVELEKEDLVLEGETIFLNPTIRQYAAKLLGQDQLAPMQVVSPEEVVQLDYIILQDIEPFNAFIYKSCFYSSAFPAVIHLKRSIMPFLVNDSIVYHYEPEKEFTALYQPVLPIETILQVQGIMLREQAQTATLIDDILQALRQKRPVVVWVDCFYESIRPDTYNTLHHPHTLLIYGYDLVRQVFSIIEHKNLESPFYEKQEIPFADIKNAYEGFLHHFHAGQPETYYEFIAEAEQTDEGSDLVALFRENSLIHRSLILKGVQMLQHFQRDFERIVCDREVLEKRTEGLIADLSRVIAAKRVEAYKLRYLGVEQELQDLLQKIVESWSIIRSVLAKFQYSGRYNQRAIEASLVQLSNVVADETSYVECVFGQYKGERKQ